MAYIGFCGLSGVNANWQITMYWHCFQPSNNQCLVFLCKSLVLQFSPSKSQCTQQLSMLSNLMQKDSKLLVLLTRRRLQAFCGSRLAAGCLGRWRCWLQQFFWYALHNTAQHQQLHSSDLTDQLSKVSVLCFTQKNHS